MTERIKHGDIGYSYAIYPHEHLGWFYFIYFKNEKMPCTESSEWYETKQEAIKAAQNHITERLEDGRH